jgi:PucR C-terminal helix-turn-helix domain
MDAVSGSLAEARALIVGSLRQRRQEIEQAILTRIRAAVPHPLSREDAEYKAGLHEAVAAVVGYGLDAIERGPRSSQSIPQAAAAQARRAARVGVKLGTVQRRYIVGYREFSEFVAQEIERVGFSNDGAVVHHLHKIQETVLEHTTAAIEDEYIHEQELLGGSRRAEIVRRLLSGEPVEPAELAELDYDIDTCWHTAVVVASGSGVEDFVQRLRRHYGCKLLCVSLNGCLCAWLGMQEVPADQDELSIIRPDGLPVAIGETGRGFDGWHLTHQQAKAAFTVALRRPERVTRYADNRLLAAALQNETLERSLTQKYLVPLHEQGELSEKLCRTLRTYIDAECNATSAAHALDVERHTVTNRVRAAERLIGTTLRECLPELDVALRLEELNRADASGRPQ